MVSNVNSNQGCDDTVHILAGYVRQGEVDHLLGKVWLAIGQGKGEFVIAVD